MPGRKPLSIDVPLVNAAEEKKEHHERYTMETTYRQDGFSIGSDYLRFEGSTLTRGELLPAIMDLEGTLGRGACSRVIKAVSSKTHTPYALKQFPVATEEHSSMLSQELQTLARVDCQCLVKLEGAYFQQNTVTLVLEYMDRGSLDHLLMSSHALSERVVGAIAYQLLWGLAYLHYENRMHRDVKPANVLLNSRGNVKLSDFGISSSCKPTEMHTTVVGTTRYMAPERLRALPYGTPSDVWSAGLVLCQCTSGIEPFHEIGSMVELVVTVEEMEGCGDLIPHNIDPGLAELIHGCLDFQAEKRIPASILIQSPWFSSVGIENVHRATTIMKSYFQSP